jgi:hypothetical protein
MGILTDEILAQRAAAAAPLHVYAGEALDRMRHGPYGAGLGDLDREAVDRMAGAIEPLLTLPEQHALGELVEAFLGDEARTEEQAANQAGAKLRAWLSWL